jgi:GNAT superfamily N-acetyltransferase
MVISISTTEDIPELVALINSAYRGEESKKGWTTEAYVLEGDQRIDPPTLKELMETKDSVVLKCVNSAKAINGCVFLQKRKNKMYLGMLTVSPVQQAKGIGREILAAAEAYTRLNECEALFFRVINIRDELIAWYQRRGYSLTGATEPMSSDLRFGIPNRPLKFLIMEKKLR